MKPATPGSQVRRPTHATTRLHSIHASLWTRQASARCRWCIVVANKRAGNVISKTRKLLTRARCMVLRTRFRSLRGPVSTTLRAASRGRCSSAVRLPSGQQQQPCLASCTTSSGSTSSWWSKSRSASTSTWLPISRTASSMIGTWTFSASCSWTAPWRQTTSRTVSVSSLKLAHAVSTVTVAVLPRDAHDRCAVPDYGIGIGTQMLRVYDVEGVYTKDSCKIFWTYLNQSITDVSFIVSTKLSIFALNIICLRAGLSTAN